MTEHYNFLNIEQKWQKAWKEKEAFRIFENKDKTKFYCLEMYPYPSGRIHMGHVRNYTIGDVLSRFKLMKGFNVLHPIGWDAFGMPAENAAIQSGVHPQKWTMDNIAHMKQQLERMGFFYDWSREVNTCLPDYYRWNQWIFLKMFEKGLAYRKKSRVNWCPQCQTVLANEQAAGNQCWRCNSEVDQKEMEQWFLKITDYAEELLSGHDLLQKWPEHVLLMQKNWIGKSTGAHVTFPVSGTDQAIDVFTTRVDTIFGATFVAISPEHPLSQQLISGPEQKETLQQWIRRGSVDVRLEKDQGEEEKQGIDTGKKAVNPFTGEEVPIWIANYILMEYGTGAVMAVPGHDQRDFEFAKKYAIPIREVIIPEGQDPSGELEQAYEGYGRLVNSGDFAGLSSQEAMEAMAQNAQDRGFGQKSTLFRLRDWGISRQRYWGTPIPILYCHSCGTVGAPYEDLPVVLPSDVEFKGMEGSPLENTDSFIRAVCPRCGEEARRETDTMDTFFDSSWYYFRYCSPQEEELPFHPDAVDYWLPVDLYIGGVEHAILHLIYARFFCKILRDLGLSTVDEPFPHYLPQGMVTKDGSAMSKSKGNVVDPDEMLEKYGADTLRLFILFASPPEKEFAWNEKGIEGSHRFLHRIWTHFQESLGLFSPADGSETASEPDGGAQARLKIKMHQTIKKVGEDIDKRYHLNTAISSIMEFFNQIKKENENLRKDVKGRQLLKQSLKILVLLLSPFAPHFCEEIWEKMGQDGLLLHTPWPAYDPELAREETVTVVVQINGKLRDKFEAARGLADEELERLALESDRVKNIIGKKKARKVIVIKDKLVNIVI
jgi:leucyl-tRNA synthetase